MVDSLSEGKRETARGVEGQGVEGQRGKVRASELALFYRKGLIALPITDNATINDLRGLGRGTRLGTGTGTGT